MKIKNVPGEFAFKALVTWPLTTQANWILSNAYYFSKEEAAQAHPGQIVKWPAELVDDGAVYIPAAEELK